MKEELEQKVLDLAKEIKQYSSDEKVLIVVGVIDTLLKRSEMRNIDILGVLQYLSIQHVLNVYKSDVISQLREGFKNIDIR